MAEPLVPFLNPLSVSKPYFLHYVRASRMPAHATPKLKELARRLLLRETAYGKRSGSDARAVFGVCGKIRRPLVQLLGVAGFRSLLARALALAGEQVPWVRALHVKPDGSLEGLDQLAQKPSPDDLSLGEIALLSQILGLLVTFIGPALTAGLLQDTWPGENFSQFESST